MPTYTPNDLVTTIKEEFLQRIGSKTGWGKNEIAKAFDEAVAAALLKFASF